MTGGKQAETESESEKKDSELSALMSFTKITIFLEDFQQFVS